MKTTEQMIAALPQFATVLDVGCFGFKHVSAAAKANRHDIQHSGVDYCAPDSIPLGVDFRQADLSKDPIPYPSDSFDMVIATHVIEHVADPVAFYGECLRVLKPGGTLFLACPSERSIWMPGFPFSHRDFHSLSFYDDPTHNRRPFSPQSLIRLALYYGCDDVTADYNYSLAWRLLSPIVVPVAFILREAALLEAAIWRGIGWEAISIIRKGNISGTPPFNYYIPSNRGYGPVLSLVRKLFRSVRH